MGDMTEDICEFIAAAGGDDQERVTKAALAMVEWVGPLIDRLREAERERDEAREARDERESAMHLRIRAGYDKTVADCWRAEVAKVTARAESAEARVRELEAEAEGLRRVCGRMLPDPVREPGLVEDRRAALAARGSR